jgi:hypothetical protein
MAARSGESQFSAYCPPQLTEQPNKKSPARINRPGKKQGYWQSPCGENRPLTKRSTRSASGGARKPRAGAFASSPCEKQGRIVHGAGMIEGHDEITAAKSDIVEHPIIEV